MTLTIVSTAPNNMCCVFLWFVLGGKIPDILPNIILRSVLCCFVQQNRIEKSRIEYTGMKYTVLVYYNIPFDSHTVDIPLNFNHVILYSLLQCGVCCCVVLRSVILYDVILCVVIWFCMLCGVWYYYFLVHGVMPCVVCCILCIFRMWYHLTDIDLD